MYHKIGLRVKVILHHFGKRGRDLWGDNYRKFGLVSINLWHCDLSEQTAANHRLVSGRKSTNQLPK